MTRQQALTIFLDQFQGQGYQSLCIDNLTISQFTEFMKIVFESLEKITLIKIPVGYDAFCNRNYTPLADHKVCTVWHNGKHGESIGRENGTSREEGLRQKHATSFKAYISGSPRAATTPSFSNYSSSIA